MYEEVKTFEEMTGAERQSLLASVVAALQEAAERADGHGDWRNAANSLALAGTLQGYQTSFAADGHTSAELIIEQGIRFVCSLDTGGVDSRSLH